MWKRLIGERQIDPDFYVEEGKDAVYKDFAIARRVFGWNGRMFPRVEIAAHHGWHDEKAVALEGKSFTLSCSYKSAQGQWWRKVEVPFTLVDELTGLINDVKMTLSTEGAR